MREPGRDGSGAARSDLSPFLTALTTNGGAGAFHQAPMSWPASPTDVSVTRWPTPVHEAIFDVRERIVQVGFLSPGGPVQGRVRRLPGSCPRQGH